MDQGYKTSLNPSDSIGQYNAMRFLVKQMLGNVRTVALVSVTKCTNSGGVTAVGTVDVQPLVNQVDGYGNAVQTGRIYSLPYFRMQGGTNAVILDPQIGDIGIALFADHDSSRVVSTKKAANPATNRRFNMADGLYIGGFLNGVPQQYVEFSTSGVSIVSPTAVTIKAPAINVQNAGTALHPLLNSLFSTWAAGHSHAGNNLPPSTLPDPTMQTSVLKAE